MTLITILACIALQRFTNMGEWFQLSWFESYLKRLHPWLSKTNEWFGIGVIILPVFIIIGVLHALFNWRFFGLFDLLFIVLVLLFCVDTRDPKQRLAGYFSGIEKHDFDATNKAAEEFVGTTTIHDAGEMGRAVTEAIFRKAFTDLFGALFWFIIFGTYGLAGYFLINLTGKFATKVDASNEGLSKVAGEIINYLDWIPARLLGFSYALSGHFMTACNYCSKNLWLTPKENHKFAVQVGLAALDVGKETTQLNEKENLAAIDLINRSLIIWIIAILIFSLGYWL
jgi:AmpE protein